jgi:hypothetical protein
VWREIGKAAVWRINLVEVNSHWMLTHSAVGEILEGRGDMWIIPTFNIAALTLNFHLNIAISIAKLRNILYLITHGCLLD